MKVMPKRISGKSFKSYGTVVLKPQGRPTSEGETYRFWSDIAHYDVDGSTEIGLCTVFARDGSPVTILERHRGTPEILIPIDAPFVLPVLAKGRDAGHLEAFSVDCGEAVVINAGVWHGACIPVNTEESSYYVIFKRNTPYEDVEKREIQPVHIEG